MGIVVSPIETGPFPILPGECTWGTMLWVNLGLAAQLMKPRGQAGPWPSWHSPQEPPQRCHPPSSSSAERRHLLARRALRRAPATHLRHLLPKRPAVGRLGACPGRGCPAGPPAHREGGCPWRRPRPLTPKPLAVPQVASTGNDPLGRGETLVVPKDLFANLSASWTLRGGLAQGHNPHTAEILKNSHFLSSL